MGNVGDLEVGTTVGLAVVGVPLGLAVVGVLLGLAVVGESLGIIVFGQDLAGPEFLTSTRNGSVLFCHGLWTVSPVL